MSNDRETAHGLLRWRLQSNVSRRSIGWCSRDTDERYTVGAFSRRALFMLLPLLGDGEVLVHSPPLQIEVSKGARHPKLAGVER